MYLHILQLTIEIISKGTKILTYERGSFTQSLL